MKHRKLKKKKQFFLKHSKFLNENKNVFLVETYKIFQ